MEKPNAQNTAVLVIDTQRHFCDPKSGRGTPETKETAERIQAVLPSFRAAGIPVYFIALVPDGQTMSKFSPYGFYGAEPDRTQDSVLTKTAESAFFQTQLADILRKNGHTNLLLMGVNKSSCVAATAADASRAGFSPRILKDLCADDSVAKRENEKSGIAQKWLQQNKVPEIDSQSALTYFRHQSPAPSRPAPHTP